MGTETISDCRKMGSPVFTIRAPMGTETLKNVFLSIPLA
jgi:hypothetical protein